MWMKLFGINSDHRLIDQKINNERTNALTDTCTMKHVRGKNVYFWKYNGEPIERVCTKAEE